MSQFTIAEVQRTSTAALLDIQASRHVDKTFIHNLPDGRRISYAAFAETANQLAGGFFGAGIARREHVGLMLDNGPEIITSVFALSLVGAVWVPMNTAAKGLILRHYLEHADISTLLIDAKYFPTLMDVLPGLTKLRRIVLVGTAAATQVAPPGMPVVVPFSDLLTSGTRRAAFSEGGSHRPYDLECLLFTSGTTGPSKAVTWERASLLHWATQNAQCRDVRQDDIDYVTLPLFHANALLNSTLSIFLSGGTIALAERYSTTKFWGDIQQSNATRFNTLGAIVNFLWAHPPSPQDKAHRVRLCSMTPVPSFVDEFRERFNIGTILTGFGLSDYCQATTSKSSDPPSKKMSCGTARDGVSIRIVDDDDIDMPVGEVGEVLLRTDSPWSAASGYYKMPQAALDSRRNLWFHTGDRGYLDADGYFYYVGRKKDSMRRRGENISTYEVEQVLLSHPQVVDAAVYPVRAELPEDEVGASIVLKPDIQVSMSDLVEYCKDNMSYFMVPRFFSIVESLPRTPNGKVEKFKLVEFADQNREELWDREKAGISVTRSPSRKIQ